MILALRRQRQRQVASLVGLQMEFQDSQGLHRETLSQSLQKKKKKKKEKKEILTCSFDYQRNR